MSLNNIPDELKQLKQWVCTTKDNKIPMIADESYSPASSINPHTWDSFNNVKQMIDKGVYDYAGFVFNDNGIVGIDIDTSYDEDGFMNELACDIIGKCCSYTEKSKSGTGFHIFVKGDIPFKGKNNLKGVEIYKQSRFFIMTGDTLLYENIIENQKAIDYVVDKYFNVSRENAVDKQNSDRIYNPVWGKVKSGRINLRPRYPSISKGCRNTCLTSLAGILHNQGYNSQQIFEELCYCNQVACKPTLHHSELRNIVGSVTKYKR